MRSPEDGGRQVERRSLYRESLDSEIPLHIILELHKDASVVTLEIRYDHQHHEDYERRRSDFQFRP